MYLGKSLFSDGWRRAKFIISFCSLTPTSRTWFKAQDGLVLIPIVESLLLIDE